MWSNQKVIRSNVKKTVYQLKKTLYGLKHQELRTAKLTNILRKMVLKEVRTNQIILKETRYTRFSNCLSLCRWFDIYRHKSWHGERIQKINDERVWHDKFGSHEIFLGIQVLTIQKRNIHFSRKIYGTTFKKIPDEQLQSNFNSFSNKWKVTPKW